MGILRATMLPLLSLFLLLSLSRQVSASGSFIHCLLNHSQPSHPISAAIYTPNNGSFSSVLQAYIRNLRFNTTKTRKPFLIVTALHESHIQAAIVCAQTHNLQMKIRSGGHDYEGVSYVAEVPFFVLDMFNLRSIHIDVESETAWVQAGATLGEVYYRIFEKSNTHGFPAGVCPTVGVGGHFSGGGYGNMMRKYGLSVDNIIDAHLVDVKGRLLNRKSMGEDLFWAIRGGGGASFGVVVSYKIKLVRVPEIVTVFQVAKTLEQNATDIVSKWQHVADKLDENLFIRLILDVSFPELGLKKSDCNETSWVQSVLFWTNFALGTPNDVLLSRVPQTLTYLKRKSDYVKEPISKAGLELIWKKLIELKYVALTFNPYGGRMSEIPAEAVPFPHRAGNLAKIQYAANWNEGGEEVTDYYINLTRKLYSFMTPFVSKNPREAFFNYKDLDLGINHNGKASYQEGRVYGIKYFKGNFNRLVEIKTKVSLDNVAQTSARTIDQEDIYEIFKADPMPNVQGDKKAALEDEQVKSIGDENHPIGDKEEPEKVVDEVNPIDQP
nr:berberine bridge enzyme-like 8 [Quercus suber]